MLRKDIADEIRSSLGRMAYGWCWEGKAIAMAELILEQEAKLCVEIGVYGGMSLVPCAMACRHIHGAHVVGIDPWSNGAAAEGESDPKNADWWGTTDLKSVRKACEDSIMSFGLERICCTIPSRAENVLHLFQDESVDVLHIDGNHTELASVRDVKCWLPKVRPGGYVWFDDFNWTTTEAAQRILEHHCSIVKDVMTDDKTRGVRLYKKHG